RDGAGGRDGSGGGGPVRGRAAAAAAQLDGGGGRVDELRRGTLGEGRDRVGDVVQEVGRIARDGEGDDGTQGRVLDAAHHHRHPGRGHRLQLERGGGEG